MTAQQPGSQQGRCRRLAFTVLELVVALAIVAMFASLAVPRYANFFARQRAESAARRIAIDLALAQRRAKFASATQTVTFDVAADAYELVGMQDPDHPTQPYVISLSDKPYGATIDSADFPGKTSKVIVFDGYGMPDGGGTVVVEVGSYQWTITVDAQTGRATVSQGAE